MAGERRIVAAILAGGASRRFGADKAMAALAGAPMIAWVAKKLAAEAAALAIVGHGEAARMLGARALEDAPCPARGPLAGVLAALIWAKDEGADWLITAPCDAPLLPAGMGEKLIAAAQAKGAHAAFAATADGLHPLCAAWSPLLAGALERILGEGVHPAIRDAAPDAARVLFEDAGAFANVNTPAEGARAAERLVAG